MLNHLSLFSKRAAPNASACEVWNFKWKKKIKLGCDLISKMSPNPLDSLIRYPFIGIKMLSTGSLKLGSLILPAPDRYGRLCEGNLISGAIQKQRNKKSTGKHRCPGKGQPRNKDKSLTSTFISDQKKNNTKRDKKRGKNLKKGHIGEWKEGQLRVKRPFGSFCWWLRDCGVVKCVLSHTAKLKRRSN